jgi:hypothetical protein
VTWYTHDRAERVVHHFLDLFQSVDIASLVHELPPLNRASVPRLLVYVTPPAADGPCCLVLSLPKATSVGGVLAGAEMNCSGLARVPLHERRPAAGCSDPRLGEPR